MLDIIVPYRDREDHLQQFIPHMKKYLPDANIVVVEQVDYKPFNRGKLLNIGALYSRATHFVFHDVDMLPVDVSYEERNGVTQLASSNIQTSGYLGGVTMYDRETFFLSEGYHNDFFHRAEDNEQAFNLKSKGISVRIRFGVFQQLQHPRVGPEFISELWQKAQLPRNVNMLKTCEFLPIRTEFNENYTHEFVRL